MAKDIAPIHRDMVELVRQLIDLIGLPPEECAKSRRPLLAVFAFGMVVPGRIVIALFPELKR